MLSWIYMRSNSALFVCDFYLLGRGCQRIETKMSNHKKSSNGSNKRDRSTSAPLIIPPSVSSNNNGNTNGKAAAASSRRHLKVLIITPVYPPFVSVGGGVAITYGALYDKLSARGHEVTVVSPRLENCDHGETNLYLGQPVMWSSLSNMKLFWRLFQEHDVAVCPDETQLPFYIFFSHLTGTPLLFNMHTNFRMVLEGGSFAARWLAAPIMDNALKYLSWMASMSMTTSPSYRDVLINRGFRVNGVFSPRIKLAVFEKRTETDEEIAEARKWLIGDQVPYTPKCVLIFAGRWSHEKRINLLPKALPEGCVLAVVGDGPRSQAKKIEKLHDPKNGVVVHKGIVNQKRLATLYRASDFLVSASAFETLGMTVAESVLCGTPVIVQAAPGFTTQVVEGENGFLVDFTRLDAKERVAECIARAPSHQQVLKTAETRWDADLPNLEDIVERLADKPKEEWDCIKPPMWFYWIAIVLYFFAWRIMSWPFVIWKGGKKKDKVDASGSSTRKLK
jgi:glycosyltransferase involved in cell wall biosynthesis